MLQGSYIHRWKSGYYFVSIILVHLFCFSWTNLSYKTRIKCFFFVSITFFYKQLGPTLSPQSCLYFQNFWGLKSFNCCLVIDQITYACNNFQDSKLIFMISDFENYRIMILRQLNCGVLSVWQIFYIYHNGKTALFFNL